MTSKKKVITWFPIAYNCKKQRTYFYGYQVFHRVISTGVGWLPLWEGTHCFRGRGQLSWWWFIEGSSKISIGAWRLFYLLTLVRVKNFLYLSDLFFLHQNIFDCMKFGNSENFRLFTKQYNTIQAKYKINICAFWRKIS